MKTTNANKAQKVSEEVMRLRKELNLKADAITDNGYCVWVSAPEKGALSDKLKAEGFAFSGKRGAWWRRSEHTSAPAKTEPKAQKTQPKTSKPKKASTQKATQPKAERKFAELPEETKAQVRAYVERAFTGVTVRFKGEWVYLGGETKPNYEAIKPIGLFWGSKLQEWCGPAEKLLTYASADATPAKAQPEKAEPKAKKPRTRKVTGKVSQPTMAGLFA